ncbi:MAG: GGDEF domain-containing protein [Agathobacter sp.]|nr:GGDEF domain-containing protein [Agathobacter sp.]
MSRSLIDRELLGKLQKHFRKANDVYLTCMDRDGNMLTTSQATQEEEQYIRQFFSHADIKRLLDSARMSQVETIVEESLEQPYVKLCGVVNRVQDSITLIWIVIAVIEEYVPEGVEIPEYVARTSDNRFYRSVAFLEALSRHVLMIKEQELQAKEVLEQAMEMDAKLKEQLRRSEAMATVVRQIESDDKLMDIATKSIREVCQALDVQGGCVVRMSSDGKTVEAFCEYCEDENWTLGQKIQGKQVKKLPFFDGKSYMLSSDSMMPGELETFFIKHHLSAAIFMPIEINGRLELYLCFYEFEKNRVWDLEDVKFINDVKRILHGIVERRIAESSLSGSYASLEAILENVGCAIYVVDYENREVLYTNETFKQLIAKDMDKRALDEYFFDKETPAHEFPSQEVELKKNKLWLDMSQIELTWIDGRKVSLGTIYDITDKKVYQQKIERQISNDHLTGLYNRMRCEQDLDRYIKDAEDNGNEGAFLLIDMDDFQNINDGLGHHYGDMLLKSIAHNLVRVTGIENNCYRISGDEFAVIVHGDTYKELSRICKDLREIFNRPWFLKNEDYYCTMSMGVVCFPTDGNNIDDLNRKVNIALSTAKKKGKNCVEFYNEKVEDTSFYRLDLEQNMRRATLNSCNEFEVYYQPIMEIDSEKNVCCGAEALVRWNSTELGFIPPSDFIPLAEYLGLINPIGEHVLYEAVNIHHQHRALTGSQAAADLVVKVHMAWGVD